MLHSRRDNPYGRSEGAAVKETGKAAHGRLGLRQTKDRVEEGGGGGRARTEVAAREAWAAGAAGRGAAGGGSGTSEEDDECQ